VPAARRRPGLGVAQRAPCGGAIPVRAGDDLRSADRGFSRHPTSPPVLARLGTGRPPGSMGSSATRSPFPAPAACSMALRWDASIDPVSWQPGSTIFERAAAAGVAAFRAAPGSFRKSVPVGGGDARGPVPSRPTRWGHWCPGAAATRWPGRRRPMAMVYYGDLDATGHVLGCGSDAWQYQLAHVDKLAEQPRGGGVPARHRAVRHGRSRDD